MSAVLGFTERHGGILSIGYEGVWWAVDRTDFGGEAEEMLSEFISTARLITEAVAAGDRGVRDAADTSTASRPAGPPAYVPLGTLTILFPCLLAVGIGCILLGRLVYPESIDAARAFVFTGLFLVIPGLIGTPLLLIHRIRSRSAGRR
jgi:hypothetical protein